MVDLTMIPLCALNVKTKQLISTLLNPIKFISTEDGLPRDWRGFAHLCNLEGEIMPSLALNSDPTGLIFSILEQRKEKFMIADLKQILCQIDRWDIVDDTERLIEESVMTYLQNLQRSQTSANTIETGNDIEIITVDDLYRNKQGLANQHYDAFILYADEDIEFANEIIEKLEKYNLKICIKDRDLVGGITFEHEAVMTLISERCNRLIVIITPEFLKSSANKFFLNYAQAVGIDKRQRKVIPCLYKKCTLPLQLSYMFMLDYTRAGVYDFWSRLRDSVQVPSTTVQKKCTEGKIDLVKEQKCETNSKSQDSTIQYEIQKIENNATTDTIVSKDTNRMKDLELNKEKRKNLIQWTKSKLSFRLGIVKQSQQFTTENFVNSLPSLENLDTLSVTLDSTEKLHTKSKEKQFTKKKAFKKFLVKV